MKETIDAVKNTVSLGYGNLSFSLIFDGDENQDNMVICFDHDHARFESLIPGMDLGRFKFNVDNLMHQYDVTGENALVNLTPHANGGEQVFMVLKGNTLIFEFEGYGSHATRFEATLEDVRTAIQDLIRSKS